MNVHDVVLVVFSGTVSSLGTMVLVLWRFSTRLIVLETKMDQVMQSLVRIS